ncbi:MAG: gliding motility-associated C-terminal domain-containing protein [Flavobacteriales bacterium]|nr:gliding motility-associated C-terminal domain-containing protein [Flavobacteriales bacterium]
MVGRTSQPGTACDDNDPLTGNDTWDANCTCVGLLIDCNNVAGGTDLPGTPCDDGNANSSNDTWTAGCLCVGVLPNDCLGIPGGTAQPGTACDDNDPLTGNDTWDASCACAGLVIDCNSVAGGTDLPGTPCDDGNANSSNDTWTAGCLCVGVLPNDCLGIPGGSAQPGTACDDNDPLTGNDMWDANCSCAGLVIDCNNVAGGTDLPGSACDDGDLLTGNDTWDATCNCAGTPVNPCDAPVITTFTSTGPLCLGESVLLETSVVGTAPFVFDWSGPGSTLSGSGSNVTIPNAQSGTYQVIVTNACGDDTATVVVVVNPLPDASFLYSEPMYCQNSFDPSPTISTLGGVFSPSNSGLIINAANGTIDLDASTTGVYIITYSLQANGCSALHTEQLTIAAPPIANWSSPGSLCDGIGTVNLNNYLDTGTIPGGTWSGAGVNGDYFDPSGLAGMIEITYTATVGDCSANGVGYITITPAPVALAGPDAEVCGLQHQMNATLQTAVGYWTPLNGGTVSVSTDPTTMVSVTAAGAYSFLWTVGDGQCFDNDTVRVTFSDPAISPVVDAGPDQELNVVDHTLLDGSTNGTQWSWSLASGGGNITDNDDLNTEVYLLGVGSNTFILSASNGPCPSTMDTVVIIVNELAIPTGFSPNGDGTNDVLVIPGIEEYKDNSLIVFDRWGRKVYEQERYANDWEGKALPDDTYFMVLNIAEGRTYNGYLIIKR